MWSLSITFHLVLAFYLFANDKLKIKDIAIHQKSSTISVLFLPQAQANLAPKPVNKLPQKNLPKKNEILLKPKPIKKVHKPKVKPKPVAQKPSQKVSEQNHQPASSQVQNKKVIKAKERYVSNLARIIERQKKYPRRAKSQRMMGKVILFLKIDSRGRVIKSSLVKKTSHDILNTASLEALKRAQSSFPPFPEELNQTTINVRIPLNYRLR